MHDELELSDVNTPADQEENIVELYDAPWDITTTVVSEFNVSHWIAMALSELFIISIILIK